MATATAATSASALTVTASGAGRGVSGRMVEWGILALVVLVFVGVFGHYARLVQGQGERAAVLTTLGAVRTAMVVAHLQHRLPSHKFAPLAPLNPFLTLDPPPANYAGEKSVLEALKASPGSWIYDPQCACIGYVPLNPDWLEAPSDAAVLWFKVKAGSGAPELVSMDRYVWQGLEVR